MKKFLSIMLSILMVVTMLPMNVLTASAAEDKSDGVIYCDLGPWANPTLIALILKYSSDNSTINEIVMEEVSHNIWKADVSANNPAGWRVQFVGSNQSTFLSSIGTTIPEGKNCFRITEYNSSSKAYDGVWYQYPCTSHDYKDGICACGEVCFHKNYIDGKCDVCGYECPHEKYTMGICDECNYLCPHSFTEFNETVAPKCEETGLQESYCEYCNIRLEQEIPATDHKWIRDMLVRPTQNTDGTWTDGYYYDKCENDEAHNVVTGVAKRADYSAYDEAYSILKSVQGSDVLTEEGAAAVNQIVMSGMMMPQNLVEGESSTAYLNNWVKNAQSIVAKLESGEYVKIDGMKEYNKIADALDSEIIENYSQEEIVDLAEKAGDEINVRINEIIEKAEALTGTVAENKDALAEIESEMRALYGEIKNCLDGVHNGFVYEVIEEAECEKNAVESATCTLCGTVDEREVPDSALAHKDNNGDYFCDYGCGTQISDGAEGETGSPADDCDHLCHSNSTFVTFLWKIINFFHRLFNIQQYCDCGTLHYDAPVFG